MALRDKLSERSYPYLMPGERIQQVFIAVGGPSPYWMFLSSIFAFFFRYRIICVTDQGITVLESRKLVMKPTGQVLGRFHRMTRIGPVKGLWGETVFTGERLFVHKRFHKDVEAADAALPPMPVAPMAPGGPAPGWYPDPQGVAAQRYFDGTQWTEHTS